MSYAAATIKSKPVQEELQTILTAMKKVSKGSEQLTKIVAALRHEMEAPTQPAAVNFRGEGKQQQQTNRNFGGGGGSMSSTSWRNGNLQQQQKSNPYTNTSRTPSTPQTPTTPGVRYQSHFQAKGDIQDKILNEIIGNKLNAFTQKTYADTRDFIYQIMDSGETEFIRDFLEKVFMKATSEDLYCGLFAKLIGEIAHKYPAMYEEINRYHKEFLDVFEDVEENGIEENRAKNIQKRQYRLGYGQFISELASLDALSKEQLLAMVSKVNQKLVELSVLPDKTKTVEEFIDCLIRLTQSLSERSPRFFVSIKVDLYGVLKEMITFCIDKKPVSLSSKARFGLMDLRDLLV